MTLRLPHISDAFTFVGRPKLEETKIKGLRLPVRLWRLIAQAAKDRGVSVNRLLWQLVEDFLEPAKYLISKDRKRSSTRGKT